MDVRSKKPDRGKPGLWSKALATCLALVLAFTAFDASLLKTAYAGEGSQATALSADDADELQPDGVMPHEPETEPVAVASESAKAAEDGQDAAREEGVDARAGPESPVGGAVAEGTVSSVVTFYGNAADQNPSVVRRVLVQAQPGATATVDLDAAVAPAPAEGQMFAGWLIDGSVRTGQVEVDPSQGDVDVYPAFMSGHWLRYDSHAADATYTTSQFVAATGNAPTQLPVPTRAGYAFGGWYGQVADDGGVEQDSQVTDADGGVLDAQSLKERLLADDVELHAKWTGAATTYRVVFWHQDPEGADYTYAGVETIGDEEGERAVSGELTGYSEPPAIDGFTVGEVERKTIAGDGSTMVDVRYDRMEYSVRFHTQRQQESPVFDELTITARYGANIRDAWPQADDPDGRYTTSWYVTPDEDDNVFITGIGTMPIGGADVYPKLDKDLDCNTVFRVQPQDGSSTFTELFDAPFSTGNSPWTTADDYLGIIGFQVNAASEQDARAIRDNAVGDPLAVHDARYATSAKIGAKFEEAPLVKGDDGVERHTLYFNYLRLKYDVVFFENGGPEAADAQGVFYEASLAGAVPEGYEEGVTTYVAANGVTYTFAGWYDNELFAGDAFDFSKETMPAGNVTLYAKWEPTKYLVQVDPGGGTFVDAGQSTYFTRSHGEPVGEIAVQRDYVPDPTGSYVYEYQTAASDPDGDGFGFVGYVSAPEAGTDERYRFDDGVYSLYGWYLVQDGAATSIPFDFGAPVTRDTDIQAVWRAAGVFDIAYSPVMRTGSATVSGDIGTHLDGGYADKAPTFVMNTPDAVASSDGKPYRFVGWRVVSGFEEGSTVLDEALYVEGQAFVVDSGLAHGNVIHLQAVYEPVVDPTDPVDPPEPTDPTDPPEPTDPTDPVEPANPVEPSVPNEPASPAGPGGAQEPSDPDGSTVPDGQEEGASDDDGGSVSVEVTVDSADDEAQPETLSGSAVSGSGTAGSASDKGAGAQEPGSSSSMPQTGDMTAFAPLVIAGVMITAAGLALIARAMRQREDRER